MSDASYDESTEQGMGVGQAMAYGEHASGSRSSIGMVTAPLWSTSRAEDARVSASTTEPHRGYTHTQSHVPHVPSGIQAYGNGDGNTFQAPHSVSSVPSIPQDLQPMGLAPVSPFDHVDLGLGDEL